jgi:type I restriction enzyme, S subunit
VVHRFDLTPMQAFLRHRKELFVIDDTERYKRVTVKLHAGGIVLRDRVYGSQLRTKKQQATRAGDLLVAEIDAKVGGVGIVPPELAGAIVSSHYFLYEIDQAVCHPKYLEFYIRSGAVERQFQEFVQGSTNYASVRAYHTLELQIPLPPLDEQRRIVARIGELAALIEEAQGLRIKARDEAEALKKSVLGSVFSEEQTGVSITTIDEICEAIIDNLHSTPRYSDDGYPCVRSSDVEWGKLILSDARRTTEDEYLHRIQRGVPGPGDIVFVREGGGTGKAALVETDEKFSLGQRVMMFRPDTDQVEPKFFLYQLLSPYIYEEQIEPRIKGSASPHVNIRAIRQFTFLLPDISEQRRIVAYLDGLQAQVDELAALQKATQAELDALLPSVLDQAFRGEL